MTRPIAGIIGKSYLIDNEYPTHEGGAMNSDALANMARCVPLLIPVDARLVKVEELLQACDGFLLTGRRPYEHPEE